MDSSGVPGLSPLVDRYNRLTRWLVVLGAVVIVQAFALGGCVMLLLTIQDEDHRHRVRNEGAHNALCDIAIDLAEQAGFTAGKCPPPIDP